MSKANLTKKEIEERQMAWVWMVFCLIAYLVISIVIVNYLRHSYTESLCLVVNSSVAERQCCLKDQYKPVFDAVWVVNVHPNESRSIRYLADIRQKFDEYYEAYETILTFYPAGSQQRCYVYSDNKFDIRWTKSSTEGIVSAVFGVGTLFFIIIVVSCFQSLLEDESSA